VANVPRALASIRGAADTRATSRPEPRSKDLAGDALAGAAFHPGDRVVDPITGKEAIVEHVEFRHVLIPPA
jgi:hypothetical protein